MASKHFLSPKGLAPRLTNGHPQAPPSHGRVRMTDWQLTGSYDCQGRTVRYGQMGQGPAMVFVHGTPWSSFNLRHLIREFSKDYTVYYFDLLGYGQSSKADGDVSLGIQNEVLAQLLEHWQLENPIALGHDFGGATVLRTHLLNQCHFKAMILIDPVAISPWGSPFFSHVNAHEAAFAGVPDYIHEAILRAYVKTAAYQPLNEETLNGILSPWTGDAGKAAFYRQMAQASSTYTEEVEPLYQTIAVPVLILWGKEDTWIPLQRGKKLNSMISTSQFRVIEDAGHLVIEEKPDKLLHEIQLFLFNQE